MRNEFGNYANSNGRKLFPNTVLFGNVTVAMAEDAVSYILNVIMSKGPLSESYRIAQKVFNAIQLILTNKQPPKINKDELKTATDVLAEILKQNTTYKTEQNRIELSAFRCKMLIEVFYQN